MLYCPQCGAEYREGYSSCSDCHVLLVREPPHSYAQESVTEPGDPNKDPFTDFWKGDDARVHAELCSLLDEADIPHITIRKEDRLFNMARQPAFLIAVPFSGMEKAESVIREAFGGPLELAASGSEGSSVYEDGWTKFLRASAQKGLLPAILEKLREPRVPAEERRSKDLDDWFPEDATVEVWSGEDENAGGNDFCFAPRKRHPLAY